MNLLSDLISQVIRTVDAASAWLITLFVGQLEHTAYLNLHLGVLWLMAFNGRKDGDLRIYMVHARTTRNPLNFILMQKLITRKSIDRSV